MEADNGYVGWASRQKKVPRQLLQHGGEFDDAGKGEVLPRDNQRAAQALGDSLPGLPPQHSAASTVHAAHD